MPGELPIGTVTFLFSDIEASTRLVTDLGTAYPDVLRRHHAIWREVIAAAGGVEVKTEGDAFFVAFPLAPAAVGCAVAAQRALAAEKWPEDHAVRVRVGLHSGEGVLSDGDYVGLDVHRAARVAAAGHGGQVLLSGTTRALAHGSLPAGVALRELGEHRLKDLPEAIALYQLVIDGLPSDFPPIRSLGRGNLPEPLTSFVGRQREIEEVGELLGRTRLLTLTGPGGTGKTRLSLEVARAREDEFPDGAWFVQLETVSDAELVLPAISRALGVREETGRPPGDVLAEALARRRLLLVLDNFEQVVAAAPAIRSLLSAAPAPRVLCSSREPLRISGEQEYPVPPLDRQPAVDLFIERARQVRPGFDPGADELDEVRQICAAVDDLPLAIELAAARVRLFAPAALLARLDDRLAALQSSNRDLPERQRTLRGAIDWSYELLDEVEREVFTRLAVFVGPAALEAIEAVVDAPGEIGDVVARVELLADKSLVFAREGQAGEPLFGMLETIRQYAAELLARSPEREALRQRHLDYQLELAERMEPELLGSDPATAFDRLELGHGDARAAIEYALESGKVAAGLRLGGALWRFWQQRGHLAEGREMLERLLAAPGARDDPAARARGLTGYGGVIYWQGDHAGARRVYEEALELYRAAGDDAGVAAAMYDLAFTVAIAREIDTAMQLLEQSRELYQRLGDERGELRVLDGIAATALVARDFERARAEAENAVAEYRRIGLRFNLADALGLVASVALMQGDSAAARRALAEGVAVTRLIGDVSARAAILQFGASLAVAEDRPVDSARLLGALQALRDRGEPFFTPAEVFGLPDPEPATREKMAAEEFEVAWAEGRTWSIDTALDHTT